jgi:hypothetical protein
MHHTDGHYEEHKPATVTAYLSWQHNAPAQAMWNAITTTKHMHA